MKRILNQKLINLIEYYNLINANYLISNSPLKRIIKNPPLASDGTKMERLNKLKKQIQLIKTHIAIQKNPFANPSAHAFRLGAACGEGHD